MGQRMIGKLVGNRRGAVGVIGALTIPVLLGLGGLVAEYGNALVVRTDNQRVADAAAYAGALAYGQVGSADDAAKTAATAAAKRVVAYNGIPATIVKGAVSTPTTTVDVVPSPSGNGTAVQVSISTNVPLFFTRFINKAGATTQAVPVTAYAELRGDAPACITALSTAVTYGITMTGGTSISAPNCAVAADASEQLNGSATITAKTVAYGTTSPSLGGGAKIIGKVLQSAPVDPLAGSSEVTALSNRLATVKAQTAPVAPVVVGPTGGTPVNLGYTQTPGSLPSNCIGTTPSAYSSIWNVTCTGTRVDISDFQVSGTINFNVGGSPNVVYNFSKGISIGSGTVVNFGPGTYNVKGEMILASPVSFGDVTLNLTGDLVGSSTVTFGKGSFNIGGGISNTGGNAMTFGYGSFNIGQMQPIIGCNGTSELPSICALSSGNTYFGYTGGTASNIQLTSGVYVGGGAKAYFGTGTGNKFISGSSSSSVNAFSISVQGGSVMQIADMTNSGLFQITGAIRDDGGESCLDIGAATNHDIGQFITGAGAIVMGRGTYTIGGYMWMGENGGGTSHRCPNNAAVGVLAKNVTIYLAGANMPAGSNCSGYSFCAGAGYSSVVITALGTDTTTSRIAIAGSTISTGTDKNGKPTYNNYGVYFRQGANIGVTGTIYFPHGPMEQDGGAALGETALGTDASSGCLTIIVDTFTMTGGTTAASSCITGSGRQTAVLVQ